MCGGGGKGITTKAITEEKVRGLEKKKAN